MVGAASAVVSRSRHDRGSGDLARIPLSRTPPPRAPDILPPFSWFFSSIQSLPFPYSKIGAAITPAPLQSPLRGKGHQQRMTEEVVPQWDSVAFDQFRRMVMDRFDCSEEDAIAKLQMMWGDAMHALEYEDQLSPTFGIFTLPPSPPPAPPVLLAQSAEPQCTAGKKVLFPDFENDSVIEDRIPPTLHQWAADRMRVAKYLELWYFTEEGYKEVGVDYHSWKRRF